MTLPTELPPAPQTTTPPPVPVAVIGYASRSTEYFVPTKVKVLLGLLAGFHMLVGVPLIVWPLVSTIAGVFGGYPDPSSLIGLAIGFAMGAPNVACGLGMLWRRQPGTWRAIHGVLFALAALELLAFIGGAAMTISGKHSTGWDTLILVFGLILVIGASIVFWLHAGSKLLLLRINVRRAFGFEYDDRVQLQRVGTFVMISLYGLALLIGGAWYILA
jgi:hypothetical protein